MIKWWQVFALIITYCLFIFYTINYALSDFKPNTKAIIITDTSGYSQVINTEKGDN